MTIFNYNEARRVRYLERIGYSGDLRPNLDSLRALQYAHLLSVPFENLDIHTGTPIVLDFSAIYNKLVERRRGGFCYELNGLFGELLRSLGFDVKLISARVFKEGSGFGPDFAHLALLVTLDRQLYLSDVGFGEFALNPLQISHGLVQHDLRGEFVIAQQDDGLHIVSLLQDESYTPQYAFTLEPRQYHEFSDMCLFQQTSKHSHFTQKQLVTLATHSGRVTLTGNVLKISKDGEVFESELEDAAMLNRVLMEKFGISMGGIAMP